MARSSSASGEGLVIGVIVLGLGYEAVSYAVDWVQRHELLSAGIGLGIVGTTVAGLTYRRKKQLVREKSEQEERNRREAERLSVLRAREAIRNEQDRHVSLTVGIDEIDEWSRYNKGTQFEDRMAVHFRLLGCKVELLRLRKTKRPGDRGGDLLVTGPDSVVTVVQCKCYNKSVGNEAVQEVHLARTLYAADKALLVTNNKVTKPAWEDARDAGIEVWDRARLIKEFKSINTELQEVQKMGTAATLEPTPNRPIIRMTCRAAVGRMC